MNLLDCGRVALRALGANKLRAALTMLGIVIGVGAVIGLVAVGRGAQAQIRQSIQSLGTNLLFVRPNFVKQGGVRSGQGQAQSLTYEDALALAEPGRAPSVRLVAPEIGTAMQIIAGGQNYGTHTLGVTPEYAQARNLRLASGEFFDRSQLESQALAVVLGATVAETLFPGDDPVGRTVRVNYAGRTLVFRVVGVLERKGGNGFGDQDDVALVPLTTVHAKLWGTRGGRGGRLINQIYVQAVDESSIPAAAEQVRQVLAERHRSPDDFVVQSQEEMANVAGEVAGVMTVLLASIAGISLVVGGIGIMNIMLVSVTERTREIGIRKAVGARRRDILAQFLTEAVTISVLGGTAGVGLGIALARLASGLSLEGRPVPTLVAPDSVALAFGVAAAIGLFFGIYPAARASRLSPIEALRYE
jgi:putative ABC transport system permease protein